MQKPTLSDQHWRLSLHRKDADALGDDLLDAIAAGNSWRFNILLQLDLDPSSQKQFLQQAVEHGRTDMFKRLALWDDAWKQDADGRGFAPLAAEKGHLDLLRFFVEECDVDVEVSSNILLRNAAENGHAAVVSYLLEKGADFTVYNNAPLREAAEAGHLAVVKALLDAGADIDAFDGAALKEAAEHGHKDLVEFLLARGADPTLDDHEALIKAAENGNAEVLQLLINHPAVDIHAEEDKALKKSLAEGHFDCAMLLIDRGADVNAEHGRALRDAVFAEEEALVLFLLEHGANPDAYDDTDTALVIAAENGNLKIAQLLLEHGANHRLFNNAAEKTAANENDENMLSLLKRWDSTQRALLQSAKTEEFARLFAGSYTFDDLRKTKGPSGETALEIAAQTGRFDDLVLRAQGGTPPHLTADDLFFPDDKPDCVMTHLDRQKNLQQFFNPDLWAQRLDQITDIWQNLPAETKKQVDLEAVVVAIKRKTLQDKGHNLHLKPPKN